MGLAPASPPPSVLKNILKRWYWCGNSAPILSDGEGEKSSLKLVTQLVTFLCCQSNIFKNCLWSHLSLFVFLLWDVKRDFIGILWIKLVWTWTITHSHVWVMSILNNNNIQYTRCSWKLGRKTKLFLICFIPVFLVKVSQARCPLQLSYVKTALNIKWTLGALKNKFKHWCSFLAYVCVKCEWFKVRLRF